MRTKNELYQQALRTVAMRRQTARALAQDAQAEAEAAIPGLRHAEEEVRVRGIRCAIAGASGKDRTEAAAALKAAERRLAEMAVLIKDVTTCKELHPLLQEYQRAADKKQFRRKHEGTLILYEAAAKALKEQGFQKLPDLYALKNEYKQLAEQKDQMQRQYNDAKRQMQEYGIIKQNVDGILRTAPGKEQMQER